MTDDTDEPMIQEQNDLLVLIVGESGTGKSASLKDIPNKDRWIYANCEAGKRPPFRASWYGNEARGSVITDPYQVYEAFDFGRLRDIGFDRHGLATRGGDFADDLVGARFAG